MFNTDTDLLPNPYQAQNYCLQRAQASLPPDLDWPPVTAMARPWVEGVRRTPPPFWAMESLLKEYPISSAEGLALMRLAEALLRIPDTETALVFTADQLGQADFDANSGSALARWSATAMALAKKTLPAQGDTQPGLLARLGGRGVLAATLRAVQLLAHQFVLGDNIQTAMQRAAAARRGTPQLCYSYDMLGEGARTAHDAERYHQRYLNAIETIAKNTDPARIPEQKDGISIKLSALHPRYEWAQRERVLAELVPRVWQLCEAAAKANLNLTIDAEEVERLEISLTVVDALAPRIAQHYPQWQGFGLAMQAYQTRALDLVAHVIALARRHSLRLMCRLVKGAYWDTEVKRAQELGLPEYPVFTHKQHTDINYLACAQALLAAPDAVFPQFASHNAATIAAVVRMAAQRKESAPGLARSGSFELQRLHGMGEGVLREVLASNPELPLRVYAPVGEHRDLLAYLVRRLLENGANSSFVHQLTDNAVPVDTLLVSPLQAQGGAQLPLPPALYGAQRANSLGVDLAVAAERQRMQQAYSQCAVNRPHDAALDTLHQAVLAAHEAARAWDQTSVGQRADVLRRAADAMQSELAPLCALLVKEAHKTWGDAIAEVREAIDFLRYYALEAERLLAPQTLPGPTGESNTLQLGGRGAWVCISPWNFPLAIFVGQIAAALVTGNSVLAKPAEQTPAIAAHAVKLLHAAGVPAEALQLLAGAGETVGAALVAHPAIAGVVFTGSSAVAKMIQRTLAAKDGAIVPLIAETGGINAMVVDSTALAEQVVDAVVQSAFRSAGQRCSALRLLCLHEAVADEVLQMLQGAVSELTVGDPAHWSTDVGPVIDAEAHAQLERQIAALNSDKNAAQILMEKRKLATHSIANLMAPQIVSIANVAAASEEIFGPVLQVVRWNGDPLQLIAQINNLGYGLTLGIQTRIASRAQAMAAAARVGNVYINRNMIGAVVGVQPFGGEGLSGTGPKAGGPHYLARFCREQTVTINTAAAGGNASLLAMG